MEQLEKKTLWAVTTDLELKPKTVIVENGVILACKNADEKEYDGSLWRIIKFFGAEEEARKFIEKEENYIREMAPKVKKFIDRMEYRNELRKRLNIQKSDYLGDYAERNEGSFLKNYKSEQEYSAKLETFIRSRMLNIDGQMIPLGSVRSISWYGLEEAEVYEEDEWKAVITLEDGSEVTTSSGEDVRLLWTVIGKNFGTYFIDNDIDYEKKE